MPRESPLVPAAQWLRAYPREWLRPDVGAGLVAAAVVIPKAMAFATIAGLPVQIGLYTALVPMVIYALMGTSRPLSMSTTTTIAILAAANLAEVVPNGSAADLVSASATLAVLVGAFLVLASVLRLGFVANFISDPVLAGFKSGIGVVIVADQLPKLLGVHIQKAGFFRDLWSVAHHLPEASVPTIAVALLMLALLFGLEHFAPKSPAPLIAVAVGIGGSALLGLQAFGVSVVGPVPRDLPSFAWPRLGYFETMWPGAVGIALMSFTESIAAARAFARAGEPRPVANQELLAIGAANIAGGFFGAMPAGGGTTQTAVNRSAGARTQLAELVTAATSLATLLLLAPMMALMPNAVLAAVVVVYSVTLIKPSEFREIARVRTVELHWALVAFAGVVLLGTLKGIVVAVIVSLLALANQAYNPRVYVMGRKRGTSVFRPVSARHPDDETWPGLLLLRPEGRLFFANADRVFDQIWQEVNRARPSVVAIDGGAILDIEYTAQKMLADIDDRLRRAGMTLWLVGLNTEVLAVVRRSRLGESLGHGRLFRNRQSAVDEFLRQSSTSTT